MYEGNKVPIEILNPSSDDTEQSAEAKVLRGDDDFRLVIVDREHEHKLNIHRPFVPGPSVATPIIKCSYL
jgi:hypothetical protein